MKIITINVMSLLKKYMQKFGKYLQCTNCRFYLTISTKANFYEVI